jgi:hypothetical protein
MLDINIAYFIYVCPIDIWINYAGVIPSYIVPVASRAFYRAYIISPFAIKKSGNFSCIFSKME